MATPARLDRLPAKESHGTALQESLRRYPMAVCVSVWHFGLTRSKNRALNSPGLATDELCRYLQPPCLGLYTALKEIAGSQFTPNVSDVDMLPPVGKGRLAGNDQQISMPREAGD